MPRTVEIVMLPLPFALGAMVAGCVMLAGCRVVPVAEAPTGLTQASGVAAALKENHGTLRWHLERAREELK